jgi:cupin fold WbuC family metalloprotein
MKNLGLIKETETVYRLSQGNQGLGKLHFDFLKQEIKQHSLQRNRICIHQNDAEPVHEMFVALPKNAYIRPHCHMSKPESGHSVEGSAIIVIFDQDGSIANHFLCSTTDSHCLSYYHLLPGQIHTQIILSDFFIFHEIIPGPFDKKDTFFPPWAPYEGTKEAADFLASMNGIEKDYEC